MSFTIKAKLLLFGLTSILLTLAVTASGVYGINKMGEATNAIVINASALRNHLTADMMHDALRADVLAALLAAELKEPGKADSILADLEEHAEIFKQMLAKNKHLPLDPKIEDELAKTEPILNKYISTAEALVKLAFVDKVAANAELQEFSDDFDALAIEMEALSEEITSVTDKSQTQSNATLTFSNTLMIVISVATIVILFLVSLLISRRITQPLNTALQAITKISNGDLSSDIKIVSKDETGQLLQAMKQMQDKLTQVIEIDVQGLVDNARGGDLSHRIDQAGKEGFFEKLSNSVNELVTVSEQMVSDTGKVFSALAVGDLSNNISTDYKGSFDALKQNANLTIDRLTNVIEQDIQPILSAVKSGDLSRRIDLEGKTGFFLELADGINDLIDINGQIMEEVSGVFSALAHGDLTRTIDAHYQGAFGKMATDANTTVDKLTSVVKGIKASSDTVKTGSEEIARGNMDLSQRTEEQAASLEETASSMEEITSTVEHNSEKLQQANALASRVRNTAEDGRKVMDETIRAMAAIKASSTEIGEIISVIDVIAFQTNLLALNASVEAARAGEQGRGFAVVAEEVRNLASRSADAAKEIKTLIQDSGGKVEEGCVLVDQSGETFSEIADSVLRIVETVTEITSAAENQSSMISEVNKAIMQLDEMTQQNAALVEQASAASESLGHQALSLDKSMNFFTLHTASYDDLEEDAAPVRLVTYAT